jgi:CHAT domain-containing protein
MKYLFLLVVNVLLITSLATAQCSPDRESIQRYVDSTFANTKLSYSNKQSILTSYLEKMERCSYKNDSVHILLAIRLAQLHYFQSDYLGAANYYRRAITIMTQEQGNRDVARQKLLNAYYWLSFIYETLDNFGEKMKIVNTIINTAIQLKDSTNFGYIRSLNDRAKYYFDQGDYARCISDATICERLARNYLHHHARDARDSSAGEGFVFTSLGWCVTAQLSLHEFEAAEKFLEEKINQYQKTALDHYIGYIYAFRADVQSQKGDHARALDLYKNALAISQKAKKNYASKQILNAMGHEVYFKHYKDPVQALACYNKALTYTNIDPRLTEDDRMETLNILTNMGNVYVQLGRYDTAFRYFQAAFDQLQPGWNESLLLQQPVTSYKKMYYLQSLLLDKGDAYLRRYKSGGNKTNISEALRIYKLADQFQERMRGAQSDVTSKLFWRKDTRRLYEHAIEACYLTQDAATAFYFFEKSRAVLLNDQLAQQQWMRAGDILQQAQLKKRIGSLQRELATTPKDSSRYTDIQSEVFTLGQQLDNLEQQIRRQNPLYYQQSDTNYLQLPGMRQKLLKEHAVLLELFSGDSAVYTLLITLSDARLGKINKTDFDNTAGQYMQYLSSRESLNRDYNSYVQVANRLYRLVFPDNKVPPGRMIISTDGPLFPFEALITDITIPQSYFIKKHITSYTYSARYLLNDFISTTAVSSVNLLGIAPVQYPGMPGLAALTGSDISLRKLESYIDHSKALIRADASRHAFLQQFPAYKIIQLYTHAMDSSDRQEPVIYFADSSLYLSELMPEQVPVTQLIVLSACNTGNGTLYQGEGVFSFNRGFATLGIPSSVSNLWSIDNLSTYQLTEYFYKYLGDGLPLDEALQRAKLEFLEKASGELRLPYHWAPAILVGKTNPIAYKHKRDTPWLMISLIAAGVVAISIVLYKKRLFSSH